MDRALPDGGLAGRRNFVRSLRDLLAVEGTRRPRHFVRTTSGSTRELELVESPGGCAVVARGGLDRGGLAVEVQHEDVLVVDGEWRATAATQVDAIHARQRAWSSMLLCVVDRVTA